MATVATRPMTAEQFFDWVNRPENRGKYCELERGEIVEMTRPGRRHGFVCSNVVGILRDYTVKRKKGYVCSNDTGLIVERDPDTVRGPDVMLFDDVQSYAELELKWGETPPLASFEVLSPSDTMGQVMLRVSQQLRIGVKLVCVIDPEARNVTVHRPGNEPYVLEESQELVVEEVLPGFRCRVADFFAFPGEVQG
jgi:Uma2 family endonuclease